MRGPVGSEIGFWEAYPFLIVLMYICSCSAKGGTPCALSNALKSGPGRSACSQADVAGLDRAKHERCNLGDTHVESRAAAVPACRALVGLLARRPALARVRVARAPREVHEARLRGEVSKVCAREADAKSGNRARAVRPKGAIHSQPGST